MALFDKNELTHIIDDIRREGHFDSLKNEKIINFIEDEFPILLDNFNGDLQELNETILAITTLITYNYLIHQGYTPSQLLEKFPTTYTLPLPRPMIEITEFNLLQTTQNKYEKSQFSLTYKNSPKYYKDNKKALLTNYNITQRLLKKLFIIKRRTHPQKWNIEIIYLTQYHSYLANILKKETYLPSINILSEKNKKIPLNQRIKEILSDTSKLLSNPIKYTHIQELLKELEIIKNFLITYNNPTSTPKYPLTNKTFIKKELKKIIKNTIPNKDFRIEKFIKKLYQKSKVFTL